MKQIKSENQQFDAKDISLKHRLYKNSGRIRPFVLAAIIMAAGLLLDKWWWQIGMIIMIVLFVEAYYRYRNLG